MALFSANGGSVTLNASPDVVFHVTEWSIQEGNRLADVSTSAQAYSVFLGTLEDLSWSFSLPMDFAVQVEDSFRAGDAVDLYFRVGSQTAYHRIQFTTVANITPTNNNAGDAFRITVSGQGGTLTPYGAAPA